MTLNFFSRENNKTHKLVLVSKQSQAALKPRSKSLLYVHVTYIQDKQMRSDYDESRMQLCF